MGSDFYLQRKVSSGFDLYTEAELLAASNYIVVLAEPGGGKTALLRSLAQRLGTSAVTANVFVHLGSEQERMPIIIDGFDELAKIDQTGIHRILAHTKKAKPTHFIISSRSSEWDITATTAVKNFLGHEPLVVRLCEFDESEQRKIFEYYAPSEDFVTFYSEIARFDLTVLLPNPQFLKMFTDAYLESGRHFSDRRSIFKLAVERLAKEVNTATTGTARTISYSQKVDIAAEVFAKLLLSGSEGVSISEVVEDRIYPLLSSLVSDSLSVSCILATRLFKLGDRPDQHRPVHKIVSEYCTAEYLIKRILNPADSLTFHQCLPIIAPNSTVRDELRGLVGWMAALGNKSIQIAAIELDPYAVLANGDPSQLEPSSKRLLLSKLKEVEIKDPYFRRGDFWRRFSIAGFFTDDIVEEVKLLLLDVSDGHLRDLILELLVESPVVALLLNELERLVLDTKGNKSTRRLASNCLFNIDGYDFQQDAINLVLEASPTSLEIVAKGIEIIGQGVFELTFIERFFRACASLYPNHQERFNGVIGERYFIKHLINSLNITSIEWLLNVLTKDLVCNCGKKSYECDCRNGISKIVGTMLDCYFTITQPPFDPEKIYGWIGKLNFHGRRSIRESKSVQVLCEDIELRQGIFAHVFSGLTDKDEIFDTRVNKFGSQSHSGLHLFKGDCDFLIDVAFETNNANLWATFISSHQFHRNKEERGPDYSRRHMREQAKEKPAFMREWIKSNRYTSEFRQDSLSWFRKVNRQNKRNNLENSEIHLKNIKYIQENRELIERGCHWQLLVDFSQSILFNPNNVAAEFGDEQIVQNALINCLSFIEPHVPDLQKLAELQCVSKYLQVEMILFAACLTIMRVQGNLNNVKSSLLIALKTNLRMSFPAVNNNELDAFKSEVDRIIFPDTTSAEVFLRQYLEPQVANPLCPYPEVDLLNYDDAFIHARSKLAIEWLGRFNDIEYHAINSLFDIAVEFNKREELNEIILARCSELLSNLDITKDEKYEQRRTFWFIRAFYFLSMEVAKPYFDWLKSDKKAIFLFEGRSGRMNRAEHAHWPRLTSSKIEEILMAFFDEWPKVHLPSSHGSDSPVSEKAYRFLTEIIWSIGNDTPDAAIPVLARLLKDQRFIEIHRELKSIQAEQLRKIALRDFEPPSPHQIVDLLDNNAIVTVEGLRQLVLQELMNYQRDIDGGEFNTANRFYTKDNNGQNVHLNEVSSVEIIAERLNLVLHPQNISIESEDQTKNQNRIDITAAKMIDGRRRLLVIEAKGQWHSELYTAATTQLHERYTIHPDAENQGIYLVIWFGSNEIVAGSKRHGITSAQELKKTIEESLPQELHGVIDVFVLDVSRG